MEGNTTHDFIQMYSVYYYLGNLLDYDEITVTTKDPKDLFFNLWQWLKNNLFVILLMVTGIIAAIFFLRKSKSYSTSSYYGGVGL